MARGLGWRILSPAADTMWHNLIRAQGMNASSQGQAMSDRRGIRADARRYTARSMSTPRHTHRSPLGMNILFKHLTKIASRMAV